MVSSRPKQRPYQALITEKVVPAMREQFGFTNVLRIPTIKKIVVNIGSGAAGSDEKLRQTIEQTLMRITGQKPRARSAKKSISNFKLRKGMTIGWSVTMRGSRMEDFLLKLIRVALPRVRDFRGLSVKGFDGRGNYTIGLREHLVFPEIRPDEVEKVHGLEVSIHTTAHNDAEGYALLKNIGFPFRDVPGQAQPSNDS